MKAQKLKVVAPAVGDEVVLIWKALKEKAESMDLGELKALLKYLVDVETQIGNTMCPLARVNLSQAKGLIVELILDAAVESVIESLNPL